MEKLSCPICRASKEVASEQKKRTIFWNCPGCGGTLISLMLLRNLLPEQTSQKLRKLEVEREGKKACPMCLRKMRVGTLVDEVSIEVDRCDHCLSIWFDPKEFPHLKKGIARGVESKMKIYGKDPRVSNAGDIIRDLVGDDLGDFWDPDMDAFLDWGGDD